MALLSYFTLNLRALSFEKLQHAFASLFSFSLASVMGFGFYIIRFMVLKQVKKSLILLFLSDCREITSTRMMSKYTVYVESTSFMFAREKAVL